MKIPGLKTKRQINLQKVPTNGRLIESEYKKKYHLIKELLNQCFEFKLIYKIFKVKFR